MTPWMRLTLKPWSRRGVIWSSAFCCCVVRVKSLSLIFAILSFSQRSFIVTFCFVIRIFFVTSAFSGAEDFAPAFSVRGFACSQPWVMGSLCWSRSIW